MKLTLIMVTSLDGKTTKGDTPGTAEWASPEDQKIFLAQKNRHDCIVMGSATYEAARSIIQPIVSKPRIVLTRTPKKFAGERQPGLEFSAAAPKTIIRQAKKAGHQSLLLVGGAQTNARFFDAGLVDELLVVIEPVLFGSGTAFVAPLRKNIPLRLVSSKQLNSRGTLLLHYVISKTEEQIV